MTLRRFSKEALNTLRKPPVIPPISGVMRSVSLAAGERERSDGLRPHPRLLIEAEMVRTFQGEVAGV
jgi:hypothetical protein